MNWRRRLASVREAFRAFCNALGCRGYGSFQHAMRTFVRNPAPMASQQEYLSSLDNIDQIIHAEKANLDALKETFANHSYEALLKRLIDAKRIIFFLPRGSPVRWWSISATSSNGWERMPR